MEWPLASTRLDLRLGGEALVCIRYASGDEEFFGNDPWHARFPVRDRTFSLEVQAVARLPFGVPNREARLERARLTLLESELVRFVQRLRLLLEAATVLGSQEVVEPLVAAAERVIARLDWPSATMTYLSRTANSPLMRSIWALPPGLTPHAEGLSEAERNTVVVANELLDRELAALRGRYPQQGALALSGHAHIDLAWLWPIDETRRKARRTFHTALRLMERYPEFRFNQSSAQLYALIEEEDPALFARIKEKVAAGQWEPIGGMWVEPDLNMPSGEALVRQLLYGQRYFQRAFGATHTVCWLPDCFGFTPALPQLLRGAGIEYFFTVKLTWSETNRFPYDLFWWEGLDGSRVLAHMFDNPENRELQTSGYNGDPGPSAIVNTWRNYRGKHQYPESLFSIGYGDGGGGTTPEMIEWVRELAAFPTVPRLRFTRVQEFYERMHAAIKEQNLPVWVGELYLELHRGTLTTQGRIKYLHRRAEYSLVTAEVLSSMNTLWGGEEPASLEPQWRVVLRNEFHDILPGSAIREVYETAEAELAGVVQEAQTIIAAQLEALVKKLVPSGASAALLIVNPTLSPRPLRLEIAGDFPGAQHAEGCSILSGAQLVPGLGACTILQASPPAALSAARTHLENEYVRVTLDDQGTLTSVYDKRAQREVLADRGNQLWAYVDKPRKWDAWDIEASYRDMGEELSACESIEVVETGPHRVAIRVVRRFRQSWIRQDIRLWSNSPRIEFKTVVDWHDRHWLLKARFPLAVRSNHATFETAFGVVERSTHRNTSWDAATFETAAHRFADLSEPGYGVALLNDSKYGHHVLGNELGISLLRSPAYPDPLADEGSQAFTYALYPHQGTWLEGGVLMEAEDLNQPLLAHACSTNEERSWQAIRLQGLTLGLGTLKVLEDSKQTGTIGLVLRTYEPQGARGRVDIDLPPGWTIATELDLLERMVGAPTLSFGPFQVRSWLLKRTSA
jgi:alpha-mannosidase